jgi:hypothetical protein
MYPEEEETEDDENKVFQPFLSRSSSDGDVSARADDATEEERGEFGNENLDSF